MAKSILVVEDEPNIVLSLQFLMKKAGFDVRVAWLPWRITLLTSSCWT